MSPRDLRLRLRLGLSAAEAADLMGVSLRSIYRIDGGHEPQGSTALLLEILRRAAESGRLAVGWHDAQPATLISRWRRLFAAADQRPGGGSES